MIAMIQGEVTFSDPDNAIILTGTGLGYKVRTGRLLMEKTKVSFFTSHILRENDQELFAFQNMADKQVFDALLSVNGVGPKSAFSLVTSLGAKAILSAIQFEDKKTLKSAPGIGPKAAAQIILDLKSKLEKQFAGILHGNESNETNRELFQIESAMKEDGSDNSQAVTDAMVALSGLGFANEELLPAIQGFLAAENMESVSAESIVAGVLKSLG